MASTPCCVSSLFMLESALRDRGPARVSPALRCGLAVRLCRFRGGDAIALLESALRDCGPARVSPTPRCGLAVRLCRFRGGDAIAFALHRRLRFDVDWPGLSNSTSSFTFSCNLSIVFFLLRSASSHFSSNFLSSCLVNFAKSPGSSNSRNKAVAALCFV